MYFRTFNAISVKQFLSFFILCSSFHGWSQGMSNSARALSMSNASVSLNDVWAHVNNPAALVGLKKQSIGISYQNRFSVKEMQTQGLVYAIPLKRMVFSAGSQWYGYQQYRSLKNGLGLAMALSEKVSLGVQLNHHSIRLNENYGNSSNVTGEMGLLVQFTEQIRLGCSVLNIGRTKIASNSNERLTTLMRLGMQYVVSNQLFIVSELEKNVLYPLSFKMGAEYKPSAKICFRGGLSTAPISFSFGVGTQFKSRFQLDLGTAYHQLLGWSPHISFQVDLN
jgi:hypothetical protein